MPTQPDAPVHATTIPGPWGPIQVAVSRHGILAIDLLAPRDVFEAELARRLPGSRMTYEPEPHAELARAARAVRAHLAGDRTAFDGLRIDLGDRPAWDRAVLEAVRAIPWGLTASYGEIATAIGRRGAARAVGGAVGRNPVSLAIPCHRVIACDGSIGGYGGGWWGSREHRIGVKRNLLAREGTVLADDPISGDIETVA
ncbi:MAG TPA: MGMT family protein [Candidatus Limnocylindrales bacterium]|nr:MGMT family protein [Candidatus Limnocylindrales bacterium]